MNDKLQSTTNDKLQSTTKREIKPKRASPSYDPEHIYAFKTIPISQAMIERMAEDVIKWVDENPDAKFITQFYLDKGLVQETWNRLVRKHDVLKEAHQTAMRKLGERMVSKSVDNKANWNVVKWMIHNYSPDFDENNKYHAALANQETENTGPAIVVIEKMPETSVVKRKNIDA